MTSDLVKRLDGRAQFFDDAPADAARSNLRKSADLFREAARRIEALERERQWRPIEDAPKDGTPVLLWGRYCSHATVAAFSRGQWVCMADGAQAIESQSDFGTELATFDVPSHFLPLPTPPSDK